LDRKTSHNGIVFTEAELEDFQRVFPSTKAANMVGKIVDAIANSWRGRLTGLSGSIDIVRQAQGALDALGSLVNEAVALAALSVDWEAEEAKDEDESEIPDGGEIDVGY